jgi:hypothetical protein
MFLVGSNDMMQKLISYKWVIKLYFYLSLVVLLLSSGYMIYSMIGFTFNEFIVVM